MTLVGPRAWFHSYGEFNNELISHITQLILAACLKLIREN